MCDCDCGYEFEVDYSIIGDIVTCPECGKQYTICYDESWDGEEENCYWWLEEVK
jgi:hypothetical protein